MTRARLSLQEVLDVATQIASALVAAHAAGIVHRDIKPDNIMIRHDGLIKVLDFGIAKLVEHDAGNDREAPTRMMTDTSPGMMIGTVSYMSPEQARGVPVDARADIWSLGVMLYEMLACRRPFEGATMSHIIVAILEHNPMPLGKLSPDVPVEIQNIVSRSLEKDKDERYQAMSGMLSDLRSAKENLYLAVPLQSRGSDSCFCECSDAGKTS
jgi:serine/threonine protein kinase